MKNLFKAAYVLCITVVAIYCLKRPLYNWDMLPYSALILKMDGYDAKKAVAYTYESARQNVPSGPYHLLTDSTNAYRYNLANDPEAFNEQLPFYVVKPLYTSLAYLAYKAGFSLPQATLVPSFISYLLMGFLFFHWLSSYLRFSISFFVSLLIMISSPLIEVAKLSTPDCLSALLLFGSFYFIIEKPSLPLTLVCLCLSVFARMDNVISCLLLITAIYLSRNWDRELSLRIFLLIIGLFIFCYTMVGLIAWQYGWSIFFYNDFANHLHPTYGSMSDFGFKDYFRLMYEHMMSAINRSYFTIFMALHVLNIGRSFLSKKLSFDKLFALLIPTILFIRLILYPDISDRFYIAYYLVIVVLLVKNFTPLFQLSSVFPQKDP
jgi:hypothetical protein